MAWNHRKDWTPPTPAGAGGAFEDAPPAVRLLFHRIAVDQAFPLELKVPNAQTRSAMAEVYEMVKMRAARCASADEMFAELEEASGQ